MTPQTFIFDLDLNLDHTHNADETGRDLSKNLDKDMMSTRYLDHPRNNTWHTQ